MLFLDLGKLSDHVFKNATVKILCATIGLPVKPVAGGHPPTMSTLYDASEAKGELIRLRNWLDGNDPELRKSAAKRVVNFMRAGENMQVLFASMLRCVQTDDLELKKLAYLYLVTYSSQESEQAIMAVNTFIRDSEDFNPLVRALAVRNMCRIRLESVAEYMIVPLKKRLSDKDPYVRKTAAFGVAKLYDVIPEAVENAQLFAELLKLMQDENPMVVSNTTAAICEINERRTTPIFEFDPDSITPILSAIQSCSEWCQVMMLDALSRYKPVSSDDAQFLIDRLLVFLKHSNAAVVVGAFKCIYLYMEIDKSRSQADVLNQIMPPVLGLLNSAEPEVQYIVLRTMSLFVQRYPRALNKDIRMFFCKYNDPSYVKMEKLDIIVTIASPATIQLVIDELSEYTNEVDVAFVRKTIRCLGQLAVQIEACSRRCVDILVACLNGKADYAVEESIIVACDLLRKFPGEFESILGTICTSLEHIKEPRAKAAGIWLLGEYCHLIDKVDLLLDPYLDTFHDETPLVQLQILSSIVKLYIYKPDDAKDMLQCVLTEATKESNAPDIKNRAMLYWRLLSGDLEAAKSVIQFDKQTIIHTQRNLADDVLEELIKNMGSVSGALHVVPSDFVKRVKFIPEDDMMVTEEETIRNWAPVRLNDESYLSVSCDFDQTHMYIRISNKAPTTLTQLAFALNRNSLGVNIVTPPTVPESLEFGDSAEVAIDIKLDPAFVGNPDKKDLQLAIRTSLGNIFGVCRLPLEIATTDAGKISEAEFKDKFTNNPSQISVSLEACAVATDDQLAKRKIFITGKNDNKTYVSFALPNTEVFVAELVSGVQTLTATVKASNSDFLPAIEANVQYLFAQS